MFPLDITFPGRTSTVVMVWKDKNMRKTRIGALVASSALAGATLFGGAGIALADENKPVTFDATNEKCEVTFTVTNETNSEHYQIDYQINGEFNGKVEDDLTWAEAGHNAVEDYKQGAEGETRWGPASQVAEGVEVRGGGTGAYTTGHASTESKKVVNLNDLANLPKADEEGNYKIEYRLIWGPHTPHRFDDEAPRTLTLDNCELDPDEGGIFDSIFGSIDFFDNPGGGLSS